MHLILPCHYHENASILSLVPKLQLGNPVGKLQLPVSSQPLEKTRSRASRASVPKLELGNQQTCVIVTLIHDEPIWLIVD